MHMGRDEFHLGIPLTLTDKILSLFWWWLNVWCLHRLLLLLTSHYKNYPFRCRLFIPFSFFSFPLFRFLLLVHIGICYLLGPLLQSKVTAPLARHGHATSSQLSSQQRCGLVATPVCSSGSSPDGACTRVIGTGCLSRWHACIYL